MRFILKAILVSATMGLLCAAAYSYYVTLPQIFEQNIKQSLLSLGFKKVTYAKAQQNHGSIIIRDISLDTKSFSGIDSLTINYSLYNFLMRGSRAEKIEIDGLKLAGELSDDIKLSIAGWKNDGKLIRTLSEIPSEKIVLRNTKIELLAPLLGGMTVEYEGEIYHSGDNEIEILGTARTIQKKFETDAAISGTINGHGNLEIQARSENLKIETDNLVIRRAAANLNLVAFPEDPPAITIEANASSAQFFNMPLRDTNILIEKNAEGLKIFSEGKLSGSGESEFSAQITHKDKHYEFESFIYPQSVTDMIKYLKGSGHINDQDLNVPNIISNSKEPVITFEGTADGLGQAEGMFKLKSPSPDYEIAGEFAKKPNEKQISGTIYLPRSFVELYGENKTPSQNIAAAPPQTGLIIAGEGQYIYDYTLTPPALKWQMQNKIEPSNIDIHGLTVTKIAGKIGAGSGIQAEQNSDENTPELKFGFPLKPWIKQNGNILLNLHDKNKPVVKTAKFEIFDGIISTDGFNLNNLKEGDEIDVQISDVSLEKFAQALGIPNLYMKGKVGGRLTLDIKDNALHIKKGMIQSQQSGIVQIPQDILNTYVAGEDPQSISMRSALKNYQYEFFEVRLNGPLQGLVMANFLASGSNPRDKSLIGPVKVDLKIEMALKNVLRNILEPAAK
jgi:Dicarboxylate transport